MFFVMSAESGPASIPSRARTVWKTALFLAGSVALSGVTLALWNRRELSEIQSQRSRPVPEPPSTPTEEVIY
jgi:hypothetical protein